MPLSNFLLALCYHFHHRYITASAAGLPLSQLAGFAYTFGCGLECYGSVWSSLSCLWHARWDAPDRKQNPGTQIKDLMEMPGLDSL